MNQKLAGAAGAATLVVVLLSFFLNFGWLRLIFGLPMAVALGLVAWGQVRFVLRYPGSRGARWASALTLVAYVSFNLLLPDGGDIGPMRALFGLWALPEEGDYGSVLEAIAWPLGLVASGGLVWLFMTTKKPN